MCPIYRFDPADVAAPTSRSSGSTASLERVALRIFSNVTINSYCRGSCRSS